MPRCWKKDILYLNALRSQIVFIVIVIFHEITKQTKKLPINFNSPFIILPSTNLQKMEIHLTPNWKQANVINEANYLNENPLKNFSIKQKKNERSNQVEIEESK